MQPLETEHQSDKRFWKDRPKLKIALTIIIPMILLLIVILLAVFIKTGRDPCNSINCIEQVNKLKRGMNPDINPCDNLYGFVCGNVLKDKTRKNLQDELAEKLNHDLLKLYEEDIKDSEHKMVKIAKKLFKKCMNTEDIESDGLTVIKETIKEIGGWPLLEAANSTENKKFDWVEVSYKLRELGYPFSIFIKVDVAREIENKEKYYLKVMRPDDLEEIMSKYAQTKATEMMLEVAKRFGASNMEMVEREVRDVYEMHEHLPIYWFSSPKKYTVEQFQKKFNEKKSVPFNWLEFLSKIVGPDIPVSGNDYILVPNPLELADWINLLSTRSDRTVRNYMIWKVIQILLPYLPNNVKNIMNYSTNDTREEFCLKETNKRFLPSPIEVINTRNLLPPHKTQDVQQIFSSIKFEFLNLFQKTGWMDEKEKDMMLERSQTVTLIYGLPGDYLNDKILDDMNVDLVERKADTFLSYLAQANRNFHTIIFKQITLPPSRNVMSRMYLKSKFSASIMYGSAENEFFVPTEFSYLLQSETPKYIKYSFIGKLFGSFIMSLIGKYDYEFGPLDDQVSQKTSNATENVMKCLEKQMYKYNLSENQIEIQSSLFHIIGEKVSYIVYENWLQRNYEEKLPGTSYTSRQLFWIAGTYCHIPSPRVEISFMNDINIYSNISLVSKLNNPYFAKDFNCPIGCETNPSVKCPLLL